MAPEETDSYLIRLFRQMETSFADFPPSALPTPLIGQSLDESLLDSPDLYTGQVISGPGRRRANRQIRTGPDGP